MFRDVSGEESDPHGPDPNNEQRSYILGPHRESLLMERLKVGNLNDPDVIRRTGIRLPQ